MSLPRRDRRPAAAPVSTFVVFALGGRRFALSTRQVAAVAETPAVNPLSAAGRPAVLGLVAHRGHALPLVDLAARLGVAAATVPRAHAIVVEHGGRRAAFPVDALGGLERVAGDGLPAGCATFDAVRALFAADGEATP